MQVRDNMEVVALVWFYVWPKCCTDWDECGGALSWRICQFLDDHWSLAAHCVGETSHNLYIIFLINCSTRWSKLMMYNAVLMEENCGWNFCLASNLVKFLRPWRRRRFANRWLGLCFGIVALGTRFIASDNVPESLHLTVHGMREYCCT